MASRYVLFLLVMVSALPVHGVTFNWDDAYAASAPSAPGNGSFTFRNYNSDGSYAGNDIQISLTNNNTGATWFSGYPLVGNRASSNNNISGGFGNNAKALQLILAEGNNAGITLKISFLNYAATNVALTILDVDESSPQFIDVISGISGKTLGGGSVNPSSITGSSANFVSGTTVTGDNVADDTSSNGNVGINFGGSTVTEVSFTWTNTGRDLGRQAIALYDFSYDRVPVPEASASVAALALCGFAFTRRSRRLTKHLSQSAEKLPGPAS